VETHGDTGQRIPRGGHGAIRRTRLAAVTMAAAALMTLTVVGASGASVAPGETMAHETHCWTMTPFADELRLDVALVAPPTVGFYTISAQWWGNGRYLIEGAGDGQVNHNGTRVSVSFPVGVRVGDRVTGYLSYDTNGATDNVPSDPTTAEYVYNPAGANAFSIEINGLRWASGNTLSIQGENNHFFEFDGSYQSLFDIGFLDAGSSLPGHQLAGQGAVTFQIANVFTSPLNTLRNSDQLPTSLSDVDLSAATDTTVYVLSDYPTYRPGRYGFFVSLERSSIRLAARISAAIPETIDIKSGSFPNSINPKSNGVIPVAILTTNPFDATTVDPLSIKFGPQRATEAHGRGHNEDVDGDGDVDLVLHFRTQEIGLQSGAAG
jgi:hypothetical protein